MVMPREVLPELLDSLSHSDPAAVRSREELRLINALMGNYRWLVREIEASSLHGGRVLELGAGDGGLLAAVRQRAQDVVGQWAAVDLAPRPVQWPLDAVWHQGDLFQMSQLPAAELVVANLFLHHFAVRELRWIGKHLPPECRVFLAGEPLRSRRSLLQGRLLSVVTNLSRVTRHDMDRSIRAGFVGRELPEALGLGGWHATVTQTVLGAYRMRAWR
jgi:SAM-dependent methyltransferase